jgi:hypothetical protein
MKINQILLCLSLAVSIGHVMAIGPLDSSLTTDNVATNVVQDAGTTTVNGAVTPDSNMPTASDLQLELLATAQGI